MKNKIIKAIHFFGISGIGWLIDITIYTILSSIFQVNVSIANIISSFVAISFVFFVSTRKLFKNNGKIKLKYKYLFYVIYQIVIVSISSFVILLLKNIIVNFDIKQLIDFANIIAKIIVTPFTMIINYFAMTIIVEKI